MRPSFSLPRPLPSSFNEENGDALGQGRNGLERDSDRAPQSDSSKVPDGIIPELVIFREEVVSDGPPIM
jgi:hypothetical protein